jgi:uncharacterized membrane protein YhdT
MTDKQEPPLFQKQDLNGLGGWLILVGFGILASPLRILAFVFPTYSKILSDGSWEKLTTPGEPAYHALWGPIMGMEIAVNCLFMAAWLYIAYLFFSKKRAFPTWYVCMHLITLAFILLDAIAIKLVLPDEPIFDADTAKELARSVVQSVVWIPYMWMSERVKATFIK